MIGWHKSNNAYSAPFCSIYKMTLNRTLMERSIKLSVCWSVCLSVCGCPAGVEGLSHQATNQPTVLWSRTCQQNKVLLSCVTMVLQLSRCESQIQVRISWFSLPSTYHRAYSQQYCLPCPLQEQECLQATICHQSPGKGHQASFSWQFFCQPWTIGQLMFCSDLCTCSVHLWQVFA